MAQWPNASLVCVYYSLFFSTCMFADLESTKIGRDELVGMLQALEKELKQDMKLQQQDMKQELKLQLQETSTKIQETNTKIQETNTKITALEYEIASRTPGIYCHCMVDRLTLTYFYPF